MTQQTLSIQPRTTYAGLQITAQLAIIRESSDVEMKTPDSINEACDDLRQLTQETFITFTLDAKNNVIGRHLISLGIVDATLIHPREVFRPALIDGAAAIICAHNHPSGDPTPSTDDIKITRQLVEAGKIIGINILDHVIIGRPSEANREGFLSLRESGIVSF